MQGLGVGPRRRSSLFVLALVAGYILLLVTGPLGHHDLRCHLKSPTHCTACIQAPVAGSANGPLATGAPFAAASAVLFERPVRPGVPAVSEPGDRSPPLA
jgi:hypothetical protein